MQAEVTQVILLEVTLPAVLPAADIPVLSVRRPVLHTAPVTAIIHMPHAIDTAVPVQAVVTLDAVCGC